MKLLQPFCGPDARRMAVESRWGPGRLSNISREPGFSMISLLPSPCLAVKGALKGTVVTTCKRGAQLRPKGRAQPSARLRS